MVQTYGGPHEDWGYDILPLDDGGTLAVGRANVTYWTHGTLPGDARLIRTDHEGEVLWERDYGGRDGQLYSLIQVAEDEFVALGTLADPYQPGDADMYLLKVDGDGNEIWSHTYGGRGADSGGTVAQTSDGGYVLVGALFDDFPTNDRYEGDLYVVRTDAQGNQLWAGTYGDGIIYLGFGIEETLDGGFVFGGWEAKTYEDRDFIVIKIDERGGVEWSRTWDLDPGERDCAYDTILTSDGYVLIVGTKSMNEGPRRAAIVKVDLEGNEIWSKRYARVDGETEFWDVLEDTDGGYLMCGAMISNRDPETGQGDRVGLVVKMNSAGVTLWEATLIHDAYSAIHFSSAALVPDGSLLIIGQAIPVGESKADMLWVRAGCSD